MGVKLCTRVQVVALEPVPNLRLSMWETLRCKYTEQKSNSFSHIFLVNHHVIRTKKGEKSQASSMHQEFLLLSVALMHDYDSQEKIICITDVNHRICIPSHILKLDILSYNKIGGF
jgi:hypothetical protein